MPSCYLWSDRDSATTDLLDVIMRNFDPKQVIVDSYDVAITKVPLPLPLPLPCFGGTCCYAYQFCIRAGKDCGHEGR